jgi:hypothetical protein
VARPYVEDFVFDEENEEEMAEHGISPVQVLQVLDARIMSERIDTGGGPRT